MGESLMKKYGIKSKDNNDILIFHALPNETTKFQWYISENINEKGQPIDGQGEIVYQHTRPIEKIAPGVMTRKSNCVWI